ncbi:hypothetical protein RA086_13950 [Lactiplantibacillus sp. WILCCON 0030]|uniref:Uncharacterized protein n=1 Tax=Lactiplantibacillus brownii TaxID=3069269 RepID=A0ABU1ACQ6_9LACO|nr:hypothetical protein [Lactiplantibacillus brownii]MDQ7938713.1 hypothetical protein [Lactiplantibacillus brownii]
MSNNNPKFNLKLFNQKAKRSPKIDAGISLMNGHKNLSLEVHNADAEVVFLETCLDCQRDPILYFSNFIPDEMFIMGNRIEADIKAVCRKPQLILKRTTPVDFHRSNSARIMSVLHKYLPDNVLDEYHDGIREADMDNDPNQLTRRSAFRVFLVYAVSEPGTSKEKNWLAVIFFDPYHLIFPVKQLKQSTDEYLLAKYREVAPYQQTFRKYFEEEFKQVSFIRAMDLLA